MRILAIDPGTEQSGFVVYSTVMRKITDHGIYENWLMGQRILEFADNADFGLENPSMLAVEMIANYGGDSVGKDVYETAVWIGRFIQAWDQHFGRKTASSEFYVYRKEVSLELCNARNAKPKNIRQAIIDRFGGELKAIGGKKCPECKGKGWKGRDHTECSECKGKKLLSPEGPLKGITSHCWSALGVALTFAARQRAADARIIQEKTDD